MDKSPVPLVMIGGLSIKLLIAESLLKVVNEMIDAAPEICSTFDLPRVICILFPCSMEKPIVRKYFLIGFSVLKDNHFFFSRNVREINEMIEKKSKKMAKFVW